MAIAFQPNAFQVSPDRAFQVDGAAIAGGAGISGGTFSRGRWRKIHNEEEAKRLQRESREARIAWELREEARAQRQAEAIIEQAQAEAKLKLETFKIQQKAEQSLKFPQETLRGARGIADKMQQLALGNKFAIMSKRKIDEDEDERFIEEHLLLDE